MLKIIEYIKAHGLNVAIDKFKLKSKIYEKKVLLKYDQIESNMSLEEVQDCRGLILELNTWKVMCMSFRKFFNHGESNAATIDWNTAIVLDKLDGTMIQVYYDWHNDKWFAATGGMAEGEGEVNNKNNTTFNDLFWRTLDKYPYFNKNFLNSFKKHTIVFELTTPYNIVVKPHGESSATLLTIRNNETLEESTREQLENFGAIMGLPVVKLHDLNKGNFGTLIKTFQNMPWSEEGYVVVDGNFNRVKIKNPAYVAIHHTKGKLGSHHILDVIKTNEVDEFISVFIEREEEIRKLEEAYRNLVNKLTRCWEELSLVLPKNITAFEKKTFAMNVFTICEKHNIKRFSGLFFSLKDGKIKSILDFMKTIDNKELYQFLIN